MTLRVCRYCGAHVCEQKRGALFLLSPQQHSHAGSRGGGFLGRQRAPYKRSGEHKAPKSWGFGGDNKKRYEGHALIAERICSV